MAAARFENAVALLLHDASVTTLDLGNSQLRDEGAQRLAVALERNASLTTLHLRINRVGDKGVEMLAAALEHHASLMTLDLFYNEIGDHGAESLAKVLEVSTSLTILHLGGNRIGDLGAEHLAAALEHNTSLTTLHLGSNRIGDKGAERLAAALEHNTSVTTLDLDGNDPLMTLDLAAALERNKRGFLILTLSCESRERMRSAISCTNIAGSQVALVEVDPEDTIASLLRAISVQLEHYGHLRLVSRDGTLLDDPQAQICDCDL
eukprot:gnl/TRDRNA2_/TRDRNA2_197396_c0_seq1.p1 gnl/TRDRNA2_/TRDRNA2_197396_c0~~gnl/TRDRNA2_/TRDRNA2_197396_c0_seq1.p1  ORF type:complete len:264 (+),score=31.36 gnl/TRDRNA2_/TRDRNA2_197396_c0_seq1:83-874(+)